MDRRKIIRWGVRIILILGILAIVNFFHVAGWEIRSVSAISAASTATVTLYPHMEQENRTTITLNEDQILALKELIQTSTFIRDPSVIIRWNQPDILYYDILIDFGESPDPLFLHATGGHHLTIPDQFDSDFLRILSPDWEEELTSIIFLENT